VTIGAAEENRRFLLALIESLNEIR
jgi:hypothetical protein